MLEGHHPYSNSGANMISSAMSWSSLSRPRSFFAIEVFFLSASHPLPGCTSSSSPGLMPTRSSKARGRRTTPSTSIVTTCVVATLSLRCDEYYAALRQKRHCCATGHTCICHPERLGFALRPVQDGAQAVPCQRANTIVSQLSSACKTFGLYSSTNSAPNTVKRSSTCTSFFW